MNTIRAIDGTTPRTDGDRAYMDWLIQQHPTSRALLVHIAGSSASSGASESEEAPGSDVPAKSTVIAGENPSGDVENVSVDAAGRVNTNGSSEKQIGTGMPTNADVVGFKDSSGNVSVPQLDSSGRLPVLSTVKGSLTDAEAIVPTRIVKTVTSSGTPEAIAADNTFFRHATIIAKKAARTANTGTIYLGVTSTNDDQSIDMEPGDIWRIVAPVGSKLDLNDFYVDVTTNGDGVVVIYY